MRFRDKATGATFEPSDAGVAAMMAANPNLERLDGGAPKAAPKRRAAKAKG